MTKDKCECARRSYDTAYAFRHLKTLISARIVSARIQGRSRFGRQATFTETTEKSGKPFNSSLPFRHFRSGSRARLSGDYQQCLLRHQRRKSAGSSWQGRRQLGAGFKLTPFHGQMPASLPRAEVNSLALDRMQWATSERSGGLDIVTDCLIE